MSAPKKSWASLAANSADLPAPPAPKVAAPKPKPKVKKAPERVNTKISIKKTIEKPAPSSTVYDRGTPNYAPEKTNVVPNVKEVSCSEKDQVCEAVKCGLWVCTGPGKEGKKKTTKTSL